MPNLKEVLLGRLAVTRKLLSPAELARVLEEQGKRPDKPPLGALLIQLGLLTQQQVEELVAAQVAAFSAQHDSAPGTQGEHSFGRKVVEAGLLPQEQVNECIRQQGILEGQGRFVRLGEIMVQSGLLSAEQVQQLLGAQGKRVVKCASCGAQYNVAIQAEAASITCPRCKRPINAKPPAPAMPPLILPSISAEGTFYMEPGATPPEPMPAHPPTAAAPAPPPRATQPSPAALPPPRATQRIPSPPPARPATGRDTTRRRKKPAAPQAKYVDYRQRRAVRTGLPAWIPFVAVAAAGLLLALNFMGKEDTRVAQTPDDATKPAATTSPSSSTGEQDAQWRRALTALPSDPVEAIHQLEQMESGPLSSRAHAERLRREQAMEDDLAVKFDSCRKRAEDAASRGDWDAAVSAWNLFPSDLDVRGKFREKVALARKEAQARRASEAAAHGGNAPPNPSQPPPSQTPTPQPPDAKRQAALSRVEEARAQVKSRRKAIEDAKSADRARLVDATTKKPIDIDLGGSDVLKGCSFSSVGDEGATIAVTQPKIPAYSIYFSALQAPVLLQIRRLMTDPADVAGHFALGKYAARLGLYADADHEFKWVVGKDASYQSKVPDLAKLKDRGLVFHGQMSGNGWGRYKVSYDFKKPEEASDFAVEAGTVSIDKGQLVLSGHRAVEARLKEIALVEEADLSAEIGPVQANNFACWGLSLQCAGGKGLEVYVAKDEKGSFIMEYNGGDKYQEKATLPSDMKAPLHFKLSHGTTLTATLGKEQVWTETVAPVSSCAVVLLGYGKGNTPILVSFGKLSVEGKFGQEWMRKAKKDSEVRALRTLEEDLALTVIDDAALKLPPLSVEGSGGLPADAAQEFTQARQQLARRDMTYDDAFKALDTIRRLGEQYPHFPGTLYVAAQFLEMLGVDDMAFDALDRALAIAPSFYEALVLRSDFHVRRHELAEATKDLDRALDIAPDLAAAWRGKGYLRLAEKGYTDALDDLELALALDPSDTRAVRYLKYVRHLATGPWPKEGGKTEHVKETAHYRVRTDLDTRKAEAFVTRLEKARATYEERMTPVAANDAKSEVLIFDSEEAYHTYAELTGDDRVESTLGYFHPIYGQLFLFEGALDASGQETMHVLYHEGFHQYMEPILPFAPTWLSEGLAEYNAGKALEKELAGKKDPFLGLRLENLKGAMSHGFPTDFEHIMDMSQAEFYSGLGPIYYAQGWAMCQYFYDAAPDGEKKAFLQYIDDLKKGMTREDARKQAFASFDLKAVERHWRDWVTALKW